MHSSDSRAMRSSMYHAFRTPGSLELAAPDTNHDPNFSLRDQSDLLMCAGKKAKLCQGANILEVGGILSWHNDHGSQEYAESPRMATEDMPKGGHNHKHHEFIALSITFANLRYPTTSTPPALRIAAFVIQYPNHHRRHPPHQHQRQVNYPALAF